MVNGQVHLAVIDDGISEELLGLKLYKDIQVNSGCIVDSQQEKRSGITHGTVCMGIIKKYESNILVSSLCVLDEEKKGNAGSLYRALKWCCENEVDIVNISLGSHCYWDELEIRRHINLCNKKGVLLVCAADNKGVWTYPASCSNAIGVKSDKESKLKSEEWMISDSYLLDGIEIIAYADHKIRLSTGIEIECKGANSYAAPLITAMLLQELKIRRFGNCDEAKDWLAEKAKNQMMQDIFYNRIDWIDEAICIHYGEKKYIEPDIPYIFTMEYLMVNNIDDLIRRESYYEGKDAAFIYSENVISLKEAEKMKYILQEKGIAVIFSDSKNLNYNIDILNRNHTKVFYPQGCNILASFEKKEKIDIPVIEVICKQESELAWVAKQLQKSFEKEGYVPLVCTQDIWGICCDFVYVANYLNEEALVQITQIRMSDLCILVKKEREELDFVDVYSFLERYGDEIVIRIKSDDGEIKFVSLYREAGYSLYKGIMKVIS